MTEELQNLLERIQKDGVDKAENESRGIISAAKDQAKKIVNDAEEQAESAIANAERTAQTFQIRAEKALKQTARDIVLSVEESVSATMRNIVNSQISNALSVDTLKSLLDSVVKAYCNNEGSPIELLLNAKQQQEIKDYFTDKLKSEMQNGLEIKSDDSVASGFMVNLVDNNIQHDFSGKAITDAMCQLLRPHLTRIMRASEEK